MVHMVHKHDDARLTACWWGTNDGGACYVCMIVEVPNIHVTDHVCESTTLSDCEGLRIDRHDCGSTR